MIATREPAHDGRVDLMTIEREVQRLLIVENPHRRALGRGLAIKRRLLREDRRRDRLLPDLVVEHAVEDGWCLGPSRRQVGGRQVGGQKHEEGRYHVTCA